MIKGIFGGYDARFSSTKFFRHNHNYGEDQLRDMWEYELSFTPDEVRKIVIHSWELLEAKFTYYFSDKNCAYQMARLLELIVEQPLLHHSLWWSMPSTVFDHLVEVERNGVPLVKNVKRIPSRQNRFYHAFDNLRGEQKLALEQLVTPKTLDFNIPAYQTLSTQDKISIVESLFDYYEYQIAENSDKNLFKAEKQTLLLERLRLPANSKEAENALDPRDALPPNKGPLPNLVRSGYLYNEQFKSGLQLEVHPAYYDFLSLESGRLPNSSLMMFDIKIAFLDDDFSLRSLDFVNVESLNVSRTHLPADSRLSWKIKVAVEENDVKCEDCLVFRATGGLGKSTALAGALVLYGMADLHVQSKFEESGTLGSTIRAGFLLNAGRTWKTRLDIGKRYSFNGDRDPYDVAVLENRYGADRNWDVRFSYFRNVTNEINASFSLYW